MIFSFLTPENIFSRYQAAKRYTELLTEPFPEFDRIARNKPHDGIDPRYPKTTDGTTASILRKTPKRVIQQLPTGVIKSDDENAWLPIVAQFIYTNKILKYANDEYDLIQKCWTVVEKGLTFGAAGTYTPFLNKDGYFSPDLTIPYWGDIFLQKGKKSGYSCSYVFMRAWWQKEDVEELIDRETQLAKSAKERGEKYDSSWDIKALKDILDADTLKDQKAKPATDEERATNPSGIELVTGFQKGVGATFFTFNPSKKVIVRKKKNKDPRGKIPIDWMYGDVDGNNPLGRGIVELIGGLQNLIDSDMQMYQYNRALMLAPPVIKRGNFNKNKIVYEPNRIIDVGTDPNADIIPLKIDTSAVTNYPQLYGLQKSQLLNLVTSPDTSISSDIGNPGFSKTPEGLKQNAASISVDDNHVRKMFEKWFENWSENAVNLYFAERTGIEELQLDKDTANKLRKLATEGYFDEAQLSEDNKIRIDYDTATPALQFCVDASTSKMKDDSESLQSLIGLLETLEGNQLLQQVVMQYPEKIVGAWNSIVSSSGVEDPENLSIDIEEFKQKLEQQQIVEQEAVEAQTMQAEQQAQLPQEIPQEAHQLSPEDEQVIMQLQSLGFGEDQIGQAVTLLNQGASSQEVMAQLGVS